MSETRESVRLTQTRNFQFDIRFGEDLPALQSDEPPPIGEGGGPTPVQLLAAAVGNCLSASLLFALRKYKQAPEPLACTVQAEVGRNAQGRLRVLGLQVDLHLGVAASALDHLDRVLSSFESFCTVTQSLTSAIPVQVGVFDAEGAKLK
ncbi:MAG: OsmC family protein [Rubrivivax sp.]|nr:OsmC family protein [Rubrivivax sp.]MDH5338425.1 OsmC family protein [Rubrivivax sp.]